MLRQTFVHVKGVGEATERLIWDSGAADWPAFRASARHIRGIGRMRRDLVLRELDRSEGRLARGDAGYFAKQLTSRDRWRLLPHFRERTAFVDIETTGIGLGAVVTLVGVYAGGEARLFVRGVSFGDLPRALDPYDVYVTYNGSTFDVPFLVREFGEGLRPAAHIDLMHVLRAVGLKGGLKAVERASGLARPEDLRGLDGWDAVRLWREYEAGSRGSLELLARYNLEDILNLEPLLETAVDLHIERRALPFERMSRGSTPNMREAAGARALERLGAAAGAW